MNRCPFILLLLISFVLSTGCCGPLWRAGGCAGVACGVPGGSCGVAGGCGSGGCGSGGCGDGCGSCDGCGELYIDPWINHPADCCDPCDSCGNHNGMSCGQCRSVFTGIKSLWGYRCADNCGGCESCDAGPFNTCGGGGCDGGCSDCGGSVSAPMGHQPYEVHGSMNAPMPPGSVIGTSRQRTNAVTVSRRGTVHHPRPRTPIYQNRGTSKPRSGLAF